ncbi:uncharacterized protein LOC134279921 [Saccostrea cucullata]|uniref:uncharacterized protein LOC134279921 n=1 Tax=Saccostrea cuccullata TaxID=36930 RepID=UPI002ED2FCB0
MLSTKRDVAHPRTVNTSTFALSAGSHTQCFSAHGEINRKPLSQGPKPDKKNPLVQANRLIVTPVRVLTLEHFLNGYDEDLKTFLCKGFGEGFHLQYNGPRQSRRSSNLLSVKEHEDIVTLKLQKEISLGRIEGPFEVPPFENLQCSPIGLVPKKEINEFRLIHHLSYPEGGSVNDFIPDDLCSVSYTTIDDAIKLIKKIGKNCLLAKTDIASAFRILPVHPNDHELLGIQFKGSFYYDKCLPMGCSISCSIFETFSTALQWIACSKFGVPNMLHILDDFLFIGPPNSAICHSSLKQFLSMCDVLGIPIKSEKTEGPSTTMVFLGIELDTIKMEARLPQEKIQKIKLALDSAKKCKKITLRKLQSLIGLLNFACCVVVPGRAFLRRLINLTKGVSKPHFRIRLNKQARLDLEAWSEFINNFNGKSIFIDEVLQNSDKFNMYTDAAGSLGYGAVLGKKWFYGGWEEIHLQEYDITFKELLPIVVAVETWGESLANSSILFYSDNMAVVNIINKISSKDVPVMHLVRRLVLACLRFNILFKAEHIPGKLNILPDLLSRL